MEAGATIRSRPAGTRIAVVVALAAILGAAIGAGLHFVVHSTTHTDAAATASSGLRGQATWAAGTRPAPPITTLRDQRGRLFSLSALRGRTVLVGFFDSHCTQACPLEGRALAAAEQALPRAQRPVLVIVSVNPLDTPASTRAAVRNWGLAGLGSWHWLRGSHRQLATVWHAYRIFVAPARGDIIHTEAVYLLDRHGDERSAYEYPFAPRFLGADLKLLATRGGRT